MNREFRRIEDFTHVVTKGTTPTKAQGFSESGINYIKAEALNGDSSINLMGGFFITEDVHQQLKRSILKCGDVLLTIAGANIGKCGIVEEHHLPANTNQAVGIMRADSAQVSPRFLYYWFNQRRTFMYIQGLNAQAAQPNINLAMLKNIEVPLPSLPIQQRIASILSTYDNLIENNRRRIHLLEQAARLLYKEWFIHLRFPGHQHTKIKDGIPEGWERKTLGDVLVELESGRRPKGGAKDRGIPSIGAENVIGIGKYDYSRDKYIPEEYFNTMRKGVVQGRDVVIYKDGANIGRSSYFGDGFPHQKCAVNEHVFILRAVSTVGQNLLYFWIAQDETRQHIVNLNANTAQPGVSQSKLRTLRFDQPQHEIAHLFNETVEPVVRQIFLLAKENQQLTKARDLLLPRLMNGTVI